VSYLGKATFDAIKERRPAAAELTNGDWEVAAPWLTPTSHILQPRRMRKIIDATHLDRRRFKH
jgi:hypothetical protein